LRKGGEDCIDDVGVVIGELVVGNRKVLEIVDDGLEEGDQW
jgi:hypothetical protein